MQREERCTRCVGRRPCHYKEQVELKHSAAAKEQPPKRAKAYTRNVFQLTANEYQNYFEARLGISLPITDGWVNVLCPFHDDKNASLGIRISSASWICHMLTCPSRSDERGSHGILAFELRFSGKDKTPDNVREAVANIAYYADAGLAATSGPDWSVRHGYGLPEASYPYISADGELMYTIHRYKGKRFRTSRPFGDGQVVWNRDGIEPILYNLPEVMKADVVCCLEGERDAERVGSLRLVDCAGKPVAATTCPNGCNWLPQYSECLKDKRVIICPDADSAGRTHANNVLESLKGLAKETKLVEWSVGDFSNGGKDASDYLNDHTAKELVKKFGTDWIREGE